MKITATIRCSCTYDYVSDSYNLNPAEKCVVCRGAGFTKVEINRVESYEVEKETEDI